MLNEYFILGVSTCLIKPEPLQYRISECSWGQDEYDALVKLMKREEARRNMGSIFQKVSCRIRPTERKRMEGSSAKPFFENNDNSYVKGRISEFWVRFSMAETIEELDYHAKRLKQYMDEYQFSEPSTIKLKEQYKKQKQLIEVGKVKPYEFLLKIDSTAELNTEQKVEFYARKASEYLKARGFRVKKKEELFEVTSTRWHEFFGKEKTWSATPTELILFWENREPDLDERNAMNKLISEKESIFTYLGQNTTEKVERISEMLKNSNLTPFIVKEDIVKITSLYVLREESHKAIEILNKIPVSLVRDYTDPFENSNRKYSGDGFDKEFWDSIDNMLEK